MGAMRVAALRRTARRNSLARGTIWRDALAAWVGQRLALLALVWLWRSLAGSSLSPATLFRLSATLWDSRLYAEIARGGYQELWQAAFPPLFSLLEHLLAPLAGGDVELAGLLIANAASLGAFVLLRLLVERDLGQAVARRTLLYLVLFPASMFFVTAYTEALFLLLAVGTFLALRAQRWPLAGLLIALATLTRTTGLLLLAPFVVMAFEELRPRWRMLTARQRLGVGAELAGSVLLPLAAFAGLYIGLSVHYGVPGAIERAEAQFWMRHLDWPWAGLLRAAGMVVAHFPSVAGMDLLFAVLWLALAVAMLLPFARPLPRAYVVYTWASLLLVLAVPMHGADLSPLTSIARLMLVVFPCFVLLAQISFRSPYLHYALLTASAGQFVALTWLLARGQFIA